VLNKIKEKAASIDILFTQFGYANWIGNEEDVELRKRAAAEKFKQMLNQINVFLPKITIPFASFVYFCNQENFYLNDYQNSPKAIRNSKLFNEYQESIYFMKPWDEVNISHISKLKNELSAITKIAEEHWDELKDNQTPAENKPEVISKNKINDEFKIFWRKITINFIFMPQLLEILGIIKPLRILIIDLNAIAEISYLKGLTFFDYSNNWSLSLNSTVFEFILKNDFGFNTTHVNGRYRAKNYESNLTAQRFFSPQEYKKNGYGIFHPVISGKAFFKIISRFYIRNNKKFNTDQS
jgi:hypothetical protein